MVLALITYFFINVLGSKHYWKDILWPDVPVFLKVPIPLMPFIELISTLTKPFALMIRLFANILAGHIIIMVLMALIFILGGMYGAGMGFGISFISIFMTIFMTALEMLAIILEISYVPAIAAISATIAVFAAAFGIGKIGTSAMEAIARQPEAAANVRSSMIIAGALIEGATLFAIVVCILAVI